MRRLIPALAVAVTCLTLTAQANAQATRTWVSGVGDDVNPCSRTAPCKTFAGAISKTAASGEINALDPGPFGAVTITKALTIDVTGFTGGVLNSGTNAIVINAGAGDDVILRGLDITGASGCALSGVRVLGARSVRIEDTKIARQTKAVEIVPGTATDVLLNRVEIANNCSYGVYAAPTGAGSANVAVRDSAISHSGTAVSVAGGAAAWLTGNLLFGNALGLEALAGGEIADFGDNRLIANTADGAATKDLSPQAPTGPAGEAGPTGPQGPAGPAGPQGEPAVKLMVAPSSSRLAVRAGRKVALGYASTAPAASLLTIARAGKTVASVRASAAAGANVIRWSGRIGKRAAPAGSYRLTLRAVGADGQRDARTIALKLRRR